jgi:hypothetical protein
MIQLLERLPDFLRNFDGLLSDAFRFWNDFQTNYINNNLIRMHYFTDDRRIQSFLAINTADNPHSVEHMEFSDRAIYLFLVLEIAHELYLDWRDLFGDSIPPRIQQYLSRHFDDTVNGTRYQGVLSHFGQLHTLFGRIRANREFMEYIRNTRVYIETRYGRTWDLFIRYMEYEQRDTFYNYYREHTTNGDSFDFGVLFPRTTAFIASIRQRTSRLEGRRLPQPERPHQPPRPLDSRYTPFPQKKQSNPY